MIGTRRIVGVEKMMLDRDEGTGQDGQKLIDADAEARREFLKSVAKGATVAPAVAMLLAAVMRPMKAQANTYSGCGCGS